jgi:hypothetical protein
MTVQRRARAARDRSAPPKFAALSAELCGTIPSPGTFPRVFGTLSVKAFKQCFINWAGQLCPALAGQHISID